MLLTVHVCIGGGTGGAGGHLPPQKIYEGGIAPTPSVVVACQDNMEI